MQVSLTISTTRQSVKEACDVVSEATNAVTTGVGEAVSDAEVSTTGLSVSQNITYSSEGCAGVGCPGVGWPGVAWG